MARRRSFWVAVACVLACVVALIAFALSNRTSSQAAPAQSFYVALGDSNAHGHTLDSVTDDPQCHSPKAPGYVCVVYRYMQKKFPGVVLHNFSRSGADSCEVAGAGHDCSSSTPRVSQLVAAGAFLKKHAGHVRLVTIDIGGNDILELALAGLENLPAVQTKLPAVFAQYRTNLDAIYARLRADAPHVRIVASTQWNPLGGLQSPLLPTGFAATAQSALDSLNEIIKQESPKYRVKVADTAAVMNAYPGGGVKLSYVVQTELSGAPDIHPTPLGHRIWGDTILKKVFGPSAP